jgi:hypothetical protein
VIKVVVMSLISRSQEDFLSMMSTITNNKIYAKNTFLTNERIKNVPHQEILCGASEVI